MRSLMISGRSRLLVAAACLLPVAFAANAAAPPGRYTVMANTVRDNVTGLVWQRCAAGLSGTGCATGTAGTYTQPNAASYCSALSLDVWTSGWRLPTVQELGSLVDIRAYSPAIDTTAFPNMPPGLFRRFWSSSPAAYDSSSAWAVGFTSGDTTFMLGTNTVHVRCVR